MHPKYIITFLEQECSELICKFLCSTTTISSYSNSASPVKFVAGASCVLPFQYTRNSARPASPPCLSALKCRQKNMLCIRVDLVAGSCIGPIPAAKCLLPTAISPKTTRMNTRMPIPPSLPKNGHTVGLHWARLRMHATPPLGS